MELRSLSYKERIVTLCDFLSTNVVKGIFYAIILSLLVFAIETSFVFVLQGFLLTLGIMEKSKTHLPDWYPTGLEASIAILISFGILRSVIHTVSYYVSVRVPTLFDTIQKRRIMIFSFGSPESITMSKSMATFSELCIRGNKGVGYLIVLISDAVTVTFFFLVGLKLAPKEMIIGLILLVVLSLPLKALNKVANGAGVKIFNEWNAITNMLVDGVRNNFFYKMYGLINQRMKECEEGISRYLVNYNKSYLVIGIKNNTPNMLGIVVLGFLMYISINYIKTPGEVLLTFFYIFIRLAIGLGKIQSQLTGFRIQLPAIKELFDWYVRWKEFEKKKSSEIIERNFDENELTDDIKNRGVELAVKDLSFKYPGTDKKVLNGLNINLEKGETLVISGESGTGKSTLLSLLLGILKPTEGLIEINNHNAYEISDALSKHIGYVGPNPYIITDTIRNNLLYGHFDPNSVTDEEIWQALDNAELTDYIKSTDNGLNTFFNEEAPISTGQKQRLSIARVYLRKPKLIVLDEITANLDSDTEHKIIENLKPFLKECTSLVVTHREAMLELATQKIHLTQ